MNSYSTIERAFIDSVANDRLQLIILPTEKCNFRCTYCYEDFSVGRMPDHVISSVKKLIYNRASTLNKLTITWFGGEPLIAVSVIEEISAYILNLCADFPNINYNASVTTNGYLLDLKMLSKLVQLGIRDYQISLDGPQEHHDRTRLRADGIGSFEEIFNNLLAARSSDIDANILLRLHITPENVNVMEEFTAEIRDRFLDDPRFSILFMPVAKLGGPNDDKFDVIYHTETRRIIRHLTLIARSQNSDTSQQEIKQMDIPCAPTEYDVCYASKPNSIVIRADGRLAKCTVGFDSPNNQIGQLAVDGTLQIKHDILNKWFKGWQTQEWGHLSCPKDAFFDHDIQTQPAVISIPISTLNLRRNQKLE